MIDDDATAVAPLPEQPRAHLVERARLLDELRAATETPVVVVVGGAGAGKSTWVEPLVAALGDSHAHPLSEPPARPNHP